MMRSTIWLWQRGWFGLACLLAWLLAGCGGQPTPTPTPAATPLPPVGLASGHTVSASGKIAPMTEADLSFVVAGRAQTVTVAVGDVVKAGAILVELDNAAAAASLAQTQAALQQAQAHLAELRAGPRPQEIAAAQARLAATQALLAQLNEASRPEAIAAAQADLAAAQARLDALYAEPDQAVVAAAQAEVQHAQAALDQLLHPATASQIRGAEAQVQSAQAELDLLLAGARPETIDAAAAVVAEAEATLRRAEADLAATQLRAPFAGAVTSLGISPGEMVQPGQAVLTLADLSHLQVETTDLSERDVVRVVVGQPAAVFVKALNEEVPGRVARIAPQASVIGGDVVYGVVVYLDEQPPALRWGMSVDVTITVEE
ncbi:MAG: hypothetical protein DCC57_01495 [Chloroflexi bacterium]|nr:MAG: hypothetical protein DCC57_01495 [Chloroflexota bacterium]